MVHAQHFRRHRVGPQPFHPIWRVIRGLVGFVIVASLLAVVVMVAVGVLFWAIVTGRRPSAAWTAARGFAATGAASRRSAGGAPQAVRPEVIDIDAREVSTPTRS